MKVVSANDGMLTNIEVFDLVRKIKSDRGSQDVKPELYGREVRV